MHGKYYLSVTIKECKNGFLNLSSFGAKKVYLRGVVSFKKHFREVLV
jgi:hypothetical protein